MQESISSPSDVSILQVCGDADRLQILDILRVGPATQKALAAALKINSGTLSRHMALLEAVGLVAHGRSHSPFELAAPEETVRMLIATTDLSLALTRARMEALEARRAELTGEPQANRLTDKGDSG